MIYQHFCIKQSIYYVIDTQGHSFLAFTYVPMVRNKKKGYVKTSLSKNGPYLFFPTDACEKEHDLKVGDVD